MRTLISWLAFNNDFKDKTNGTGKEVDKGGATFQFHKHFFTHDRHILMANSSRHELQLEFLANAIRQEFPDRKIETRIVEINDVIDLKEVKTKAERVLLEYKEDEIDIFFSPGTSIMQLAWYVCHTTLQLNTRLLQTRAGRFSKDQLPELIQLEVDENRVGMGSLIREINASSRSTFTEPTDYLITDSIRPVYERAYKIAQSDAVTTLILGETGTGKEHLARYIHEESIRKGKPFIAINCSAFSDQLLESRLFGYKKGAFTGANQDFKGLFEQAHGGTIFLDEIGDISSYMQQALLRVLQEKEIHPIGGKPKQIDVHVIAATNRDLPKRCEKEEFRWDLYYRLAVAELELPTLEERNTAERKAMIQYFLKQKKGKGLALTFNKEVWSFLLSYPFPGNIRELENLIESLYVFYEGEIKMENLPSRLKKSAETTSLLLADAEKIHIERILKRFEGNLSRTAKALGVARNTLTSKMEKYGIELEK